MNIYPEQLRRIADMCDALNKADGPESDGTTLVLQQRIAVVEGQAPDEVYGYLVDEIGGAWSFEPAGGSK